MSKLRNGESQNLYLVWNYQRYARQGLTHLMQFYKTPMNLEYHVSKTRNENEKDRRTTHVSAFD